MKLCRTCNRNLEYKHFTLNSVSADGYDYHCRECKAKLIKAYRDANKQVIKDQRRKYYVQDSQKPERLLRRIWNNINARCNKKSDIQYHRYGGRGIKVEWSCYDNFRKDMLSCFVESIKNGKSTIERIDNNKSYSKDNCKFADMIEQSNNRRDNVVIEWNGKKQTIAQWAKEYGIRYKTLWKRVQSYKWSLERALTQEIKK